MKKTNVSQRVCGGREGFDYEHEHEHGKAGLLLREQRQYDFGLWGMPWQLR